MNKVLFLSLVVLALLLGGCVGPRFIRQCDGQPSQLPCMGPCKIRVAGPVPTDILITESIVIEDHAGVTRCSGEVS